MTYSRKAFFKKGKLVYNLIMIGIRIDGNISSAKKYEKFKEVFESSSTEKIRNMSSEALLSTSAFVGASLSIEG